MVAKSSKWIWICFVWRKLLCGHSVQLPASVGLIPAINFKGRVQTVLMYDSTASKHQEGHMWSSDSDPSINQRLSTVNQTVCCLLNIFSVYNWFSDTKKLKYININKYMLICIIGLLNHPREKYIFFKKSYSCTSLPWPKNSGNPIPYTFTATSKQTTNNSSCFKQP